MDTKGYAGNERSPLLAKLNVSYAKQHAKYGSVMSKIHVDMHRCGLTARHAVLWRLSKRTNKVDLIANRYFQHALKKKHLQRGSKQIETAPTELIPPKVGLATQCCRRRHLR